MGGCARAATGPAGAGRLVGGGTGPRPVGDAGDAYAAGTQPCWFDAHSGDTVRLT
ncbi:hypothetical protein G3M55_29945 [Streptomyces sp. SID8455]|nr:hypothetical protein [Streptomyces sp. SID8455]